MLVQTLGIFLKIPTKGKYNISRPYHTFLSLSRGGRKFPPLFSLLDIVAFGVDNLNFDLFKPRAKKIGGFLGDEITDLPDRTFDSVDIGATFSILGPEVRVKDNGEHSNYLHTKYTITYRERKGKQKKTKHSFSLDILYRVGYHHCVVD